MMAYFGRTVILLRGRDVGREHDRQVEPQVGSTARPEFRSYLSEKSGKVRVPFRPNSPIDRPAWNRVNSQIFFIPKYPHGESTEEIHPRWHPYETSRLACSFRVRAERFNRREPSVQMSPLSRNRFYYSSTRSMSNQYKKHKTS